jgi:hypothetical protein
MDSSATGTTDSSIDIIPSFSCKSGNQGCSDFHSIDLAEVIKHLQLTHSNNKIRGLPYSDKYLWCCGACTGNGGRKRKKYRSDEEMWDHIRTHHHEDWLKNTIEDSDWVLV